MPKRKKTEKIDYISRKIRKLERKLVRAKRRNSDRDIHSPTSVTPPLYVDETTVMEFLDSPLRETESDVLPEPTVELSASVEIDPEPAEIPLVVPQITEASTETDAAPSSNALDPEILDILGIDPTQKETYGKEIHEGLASRLEHIATTGLTKEIRKELNEKYLIPENCVKIGSPTMNPEIKAAVTEVVMKRDKALEARQKQLAGAISGLAAVLSQELNVKEKDNTRLKQLMDVCRMLCDIQHAESVTRRNFAIYSIKRDLKEHISNTKIDKCLFGENLSDTLKSAKAVTKSGTELKTKVPPKPKPSTYSTANLNWKSPAPARKQPVPQRSREQPHPRAPAPGPTTRSNRNTTRTDSSRPSQQQYKQTRRR